MSFLKRLFGGGNGGGTEGGGPRAKAELEYEGYQILTTPMEEGGQYRVAALIRKEVGGEMKEHKLVRADICTNPDEASDIALRKAQQIINERGELLFE